MIKFRLLGFLFFASAVQGMELPGSDHGDSNSLVISKPTTSKKKIGLENEIPFKGFKEIQSTTLRAKKAEGYHEIKKKLERYPQFAKAFIYNVKQGEISIHLPHRMIMQIIWSRDFLLDCPYLRLPQYLSIASPPLCNLGTISCIHSYKNPSYIDEKEAYDSNKKMIPKEIKWKQPFLENFIPLDERFDLRNVFDFVFNENGYNSLIFGEVHTDHVCRYTLIKMLPLLVQYYDVKTLCIEDSFEFQPLYDQYFKITEDEMPTELYSCLEYTDNNLASLNESYSSEAGYVALIQAAKKAGIKSVVGIDNLITENCTFKSRLVTMNQFSQKFYDPNTRSIYLVGVDHLTIDRSEKQDVYGLREITGSPTITIRSLLSDFNCGEPGIYFNENPQFEKSAKEADFVVNVDLNLLACQVESADLVAHK